LLILAMAALPLALHAADSSDTSLAPTALPAPLADAINASLSALPRQRNLDGEQRKQAEELLRDALADDTRASDSVAQMQAFDVAARPPRNAPTTSAAAPPRDAALAFADWRAKLPQDASREQLTDLLESERNLLGAAQDSLRGLEDALQKQTQRPDALRDELAAARTAEASPAPVPVAGTPQGLTDAQQLRAAAGVRLQRARLALLEAEQRSYEPRLRALFAQRSERRRDVEDHSQRVRWLENMLLDRVTTNVTELVARLSGERKALVEANAAPVLLDTAATNLDLGQDLVATIKRIAALRDLRNTYTSERSDTEQAVKNSAARIELGGVSEEVGALLLAERRKLKPASALNRDLANLRNELAQTKLALMDLRDGEDELDNPDRAIASIMQRAGQPPVIAGDLHDAMQTLLAARNELYSQLIAAKSREAVLLEDVEQQLAGFVAATAALGNLLDSNLLGIPSHAPIGPAWFGELGRTLRSVLHPDTEKQLATFADNLRSSGRGLPLAALLMLGAAVLARRRVPRMFEIIAQPMRRIRTDGFRYTLQALALTVLAAAPIALFWSALSRIFLHTSRIEPLEGSIGFATGSIATPWFVLAFLHWVNREGGLAHLHFRWPRARRTALRRAVPWLALAILLPTFMHTWLREISSDETDATIGRALFILGAFGMAAIFWHMLRPGGVWTPRGGNLDNEPLRLRQIARIGLTCLFLALAALAALGYFFTAITFAEHVVVSLIAVLAVSVVHGLAVRWLTLGERRLALKRAEDRQAAEAKSVDETVGAETLPEVEPAELAVADLGAQTRRVLRLAIIILLIAALLVIWSDITPALSFLDKYAVWKSTYADAQGKTVSIDVTLRSVLESALLIAMTWVATRNLPGLLEIGVLRRLNIDAPTRYAIVSIVRYLIVLIGSLVGVSLLGVHWSNLQWLAAGLTVGLGFGLQEIFANFISGLIVLFERPCRVGDIITIGGVEGTVTRIRTRATTILDWDNKEVIVPNKSFITERLVNWTLSDSTTRVVIKVGIGNRNDPKLAQKLLLQVADEHALVLKDPAPLAWMMGFGDSTLDFELRFFVAEINQRNLVRTELQIRINQVFRDNGIEIAFPQRDVWFRNALQTGREPQSAPSAEATSSSKRD
jgi:potassium efflux system protein